MLYGYLRYARHYRVEGYNLVKSQVEVYLPKELSKRDLIYSNAPDFIWYKTDIPAGMLPRKFEPHNNRANPTFRIEMESLKDSLKLRHGYVVWVKLVNRWYLPKENDVVDMLNLKVVKMFKDFIIYTTLFNNR